MTHGQWVAFELNSDVVHKHGKGSKTTRTTNPLEPTYIIRDETKNMEICEIG